MRDRSLLRNHPSLGHEISTRLRPPPEAQEARPAEVHQRRFSVSSHGQHALQPGRELFLLVFGQNHSGLRRLNELKFKKNGHRAARRGLAPLNAAARDASRIDMDSLNQRFPEGEMPIEVLPFVKAVNEALTRLDAGVARQGRFTANAAHELRTPIAILDARADAVNDDALKREIKRDVRRMRTVVDQLLLLARRSSNEDDDAPSIDLGEAVRSIAGNYLPIAIANGRRLELDAPTPPVIARVGRWELECVVGNLIDNALRAEPQGGCVSIRVGADREIEVIDHGEGVAPEDREQIFEPFWRKSDAPPGTGLGLAIVKEIATFRMTFQ